jgi:hypothetical protein
MGPKQKKAAKNAPPQGATPATVPAVKPQGS